MPEVLQLISWLEAHIPSDDDRPPHPAVCHGDYRLDNLVVDPATHEVIMNLNRSGYYTLGYFLSSV